MVAHPANYFNNVIFYKVCEGACGVNFNQVAQTLAIGITFFIDLDFKNKDMHIIYSNIVDVYIYDRIQKRFFNSSCWNCNILLSS